MNNKTDINAYNVVADGVLNSDGTASGADNTGALNDYFAQCRDNNEEWYTPYGTYRVGGEIKIFTGGKCDGTLLVPNKATAAKNCISIRPLEDDIRTNSDPDGVKGSTIKDWKNCIRRSRRIPEIAGFEGRYFSFELADPTVGSSQPKNHVLILRNDPDDRYLLLGEGFLVADNTGTLGHNLYVDWNNASWDVNFLKTQIQTVRERILIQGLCVLIYKDGDVSSSGSIIKTYRCNTDLYNCSIINKSERQVFGAFTADQVCNATWTNCHVQGLMEGATNYGFNSNLCASLTYENCTESACRRGIDAHRSKDINIIGCSLPDGWGAHYAWGMGSTRCTIGGINKSNANAVIVCGGDFWVVDCNVGLVLASTAQQANGSFPSSAVLAVRGDLFECGGRITIRGNTVTFNDTPEANKAFMFDARAPLAGFKQGRAVEMPRLVEISGNTIAVLGTTRLIHVAEYFRVSWTGTAAFPTPLELSGQLIVEGNSFIFDNLQDVVSGGASRVRIAYNKNASVIGGGLKADIQNLPSLFLTAVASSDAVTSTARLDLIARKIYNSTRIVYSPGAYQQILVDGPALSSTLDSGATSYTPIGDELISQQDLTRLHVAFTNSGGNAVALLARGTEPSIDLYLAPKSGGRIRFGNYTSGSGATINGWIEVKDAAGNIRRLAVV